MPRLAANLTMLFTELPVTERFGAARAEGFDAVEFLFPYDEDLDALEAALDRHGQQLILFNVPVGDFAAGERGIANDPNRIDEFRDGVTMAAALASRLNTPRLNCLVGKRLDDVPDEAQRHTMIDNLRFAAGIAAQHNIRLLVEPLNTIDTPGFVIATATDGVALIDEVGHDNLRLQFDVYHEQRMAGNLIATLNAHVGRIDHVQVADSPDRHEPGSGEINYTYVFDQIDRSGYDGWVSLEFVPPVDTKTSLAAMRESGFLPAV